MAASSSPACALFRRAIPARVAGSLLATGVAAGLVARFSLSHARADSATTSHKTFPGGPAFVSLPLQSSEQINHNTKRLRFSLPEKAAISGLPLTSALLTMSWPKGSWTPVLRPYTPVSPSDAPGYVEFLVKRYPGGKSSSHLHALTPGDKLLFVAAIKGYPWKPNSYPHITLIAGGAGITPIFQLAQGILRNPGDRTAMTLIFGVNSDRDVLLREEFERWEKNFPGRFKAVYTVSHPDEDSPYNKGYVTKELLQTVSRRVDGQPTKVFVCGPPAMEQALTGRGGILQQLGYKREEIHRF